MSTEADIVSRRSLEVRQTDIVEKLFDFDHYGGAATERFNMRMTAGLLIKEQAELITKLRADRDAAARDMQERCAKTLEVRGRNDLAETIRALPVIATEGDSQ